MTRLERYVAGCVLRAVLLSASALVALFSLLEFVDQLGAAGQGSYSIANALIYTLLTMPGRLLQIAPVAMLLGSLLGLGLLSRRSELIVMQSLGLSAPRIIGAVVKLALPMVMVLLLGAEFLVPPAQALAESRRVAEISAGAPMFGPAGFWARKDDSFVSVHALRNDAPENIDIYAFAPDGSLISATHAARAQIAPDGAWLLANVTQENIAQSQFTLRNLSTLTLPNFIRRSEMRLLMSPPDAMPPLALFNYISVLDARHQQAIRYRQALWATICIPVSILAMILIAAAFVFQSARSRSAGQQIIIGGVLGVGFVFFQQILAYLVLILDLDPASVTLALPLLLLAGALLQMRRLL